MRSEDHSLALTLGTVASSAIVVGAVLVYLFSLFEVSLSIWLLDVLFIGGVTVSIVGAVLVSKRESAEPKQRRALRHRVRELAFFFLPLGVLLPGIVIVLLNPRLQMSFHGYLHSAYTYEVIQGHIAPENPLLAGEPPNDYWLFHVLLGSIVHVTRLAPPLAATMVNLAALGASVAIVCWILASIGLWPRGPVARSCSAMFVLFGLNLFGLIHVLINQGRGVSPGNDPLDTMLLAGVARSAGLFGKYLNFNGFPLGVAFFLLALGCALRMTSVISPLPLVGFLTGCLGAVAFHVTSGLFALVVLPIAFGAACLVTRRLPRLEISAREALAIGVPAAVSTGALAHYVLGLAGALEGSPQVHLWVGENAARFVGLVYPLLPFLALGIWWAGRERRTDLVMLGAIAMIGAIFSLAFVLPGQNQYKFDYLGGFALVLVALAGWSKLRASGTRWVAVAATALAVISLGLLLAKQVYTGFGYERSELVRDKTLAYDGINVIDALHRPSRAWDWIRENTPTRTIVVGPPARKDQARFLPISQRTAYVIKGGPYTVGSPEFAERKRTVAALYSPNRSARSKSAALDEVVEDSGQRHVVIAVPRRFRSSFDPTDPRLRRVFDATGIHLFELVDP
ncbi:MAG: hypothetical protein M3198_04830 [Actinomycetota bacterium]|nr:hypothetical protein [Actinomycetota bacterium]